MSKTILLSDEIELLYGKGLPQRDRIAGKFPVYGSNGQVDTHQQALIKGPGIIIGRKGSVGEVVWSDKDFWPIDTTYHVKLKKNGNIRYWYYQLKALGLDQLNSHSAIPGLNRDNAYEKKIIERSTNEQDKIANILSSIDEKIDVNRRMNETLAQTGETLFKHYFIDNPEATTWPIDKLGRMLAVLASGSRPKGGAINSGIPSIGAENIEGLGIYDFSKEKYVSNEYFEKLKRGKVQSEDVLLYKDGAYVGKKSLFMDGFPHELCCVNEHVFILRANGQLPSQYYLYYWLAQKKITKQIRDSGVKAAQPGINQANVNDLPILVPPAEQIIDFDIRLRPLMKKLFLNANQSRDLAKLRDSLLPRLIFGKIKV